MTRPAVDSNAAHGRLDRDGRLIEADPPLMELHLRAGGSEGGPLAVPQIARLARLAQRLGVLVSRPVVAADGDTDVDLWVRAAPENDEVALSVGGWTRRSVRLRTAPAAREQDLVRAGADWLWETDQTLRVTALTAPAEAIGEPAAEVIGRPLTSLFRFLADPDGALPILSALAAQRSFEGQTAEIARNSARVRLSAAPLVDANGRFSGFRGSAALEEIAAPPASARPSGAPLDLRLEEALRGPLARIVESAEQIGAQTIGPLRRDYADYAGSIANAGRHLLALVDDLADLQAIERPDFACASARLDLAQLARRAVRLLDSAAAEHGVRIDAPAADERLAALGEERRVVQILVNLIGNAVRFSPPGGMVWVRAEREGDQAVIVVADQGKGIDMLDHERVFEKFTRLEQGDGSGSGLGLYIARRLARAMGGDVTVDSALGQGARFAFALPAA